MEKEGLGAPACRHEKTNVGAEWDEGSGRFVEGHAETGQNDKQTNAFDRRVQVLNRRPWVREGGNPGKKANRAWQAYAF